MLLYDWRFTANKFVLAPSPSRPRAQILLATEPLQPQSVRNILHDGKMDLLLMNTLHLVSLRVTQLCPQAVGSRRAPVEVFEPPSTCSTLQSQSKVTLRLTVSQSVSLGVEPHLGLTTRYLLLFDNYGRVFVDRPL
jgi:hypothetical protein